MSEKAWRMLKHMRRQILWNPARYVQVRGAAVSIGVDPVGSECDGLVDELLQAGYIQSYPSLSLSAHGLYRLTDQGIAAAKEAAAEDGYPTPLQEELRRAYRGRGGVGSSNRERRPRQTPPSLEC